MVAAARRPAAVRSLVLVEPALHVLALTDAQVQADPVASGHLQRMGELMMSTSSPGEYGVAFARSLRPVGGGAPDLDARDRDAGRATTLGCALLQARMAAPEAMCRAVATLSGAALPVLVISGGWSPSFDAVGDVVARLTNGRHVTVASPNHFPQLENPDGFNRIVDAFLREAEASRPG